MAERVVVLSLICDSVVVVGAMLMAFWLRFCTWIVDFGVLAPVTLRDYAGYIAAGTISLLLILLHRQLYEKAVLLRFGRVSRQIIEGCAIWFAGFLSITLMLKFQPPISRLYVTIAAGNVLIGLLLWRWALNCALNHSTSATILRQRVVFVGWSADAKRVAAAFAAEDVIAYELVGHVTFRSGERHTSGEAAAPLGEYENLPGILHEHAIDMVILTDPNCAKGEIVSLANLCEREMIQFKVIPSYFQILVSGLHLETVSGVPILGVSQLPLDRPFNILAKRLVDIVGALVGLALALPLICVFSFLIYRESLGPVIFSQQRLGRRGKPFRIYKLRSMKIGADCTDHLNQSTQREDTRLLKVGGFMRRWNIDELPQFLNVLMGEMSLVGPRPERTFHSEKLSTTIPHYNARLNVKPGITGWAQVKGLRGDTDLRERIKCDLFYLENWNLMLDFQIMIMTFIYRDNAY